MHPIYTLANATGIAPRLFIENAAWRRILLYVRSAANLEVKGKPRAVEINGFGLLEQHDNDFYLVSPDHVFITEQQVMSGHAEYSGRGLAKLNHKLRQMGRNKNDLKLQWHSHVYGTAAQSSTDMNSIEQVYGPGGYDFMLSLVTNVRGEVMTRFDCFRPFRMGAAIQTVLYDAVDTTAEQALVNAEIADKVTDLEPKKPKGGYPMSALFGSPEVIADPDDEDFYTTIDDLVAHNH